MRTTISVKCKNILSLPFNCCGSVSTSTHWSNRTSCRPHRCWTWKMSFKYTGTYSGFGESIRIHRRKEEDVGDVEEPTESDVGRFVTGKVRDESKDHFTTDDFIAVNVTHQLDLRHKQISTTAFQRVAHFDDPKITTFHRFADGRQADKVRVATCDPFQPGRHLVEWQVPIVR